MRWQAISNWFDPEAHGEQNAGLNRIPLFRRIFWVGLIVRIAYVTLAHTYRVSTYEDHFQFGFEAARIARAVVAGRGYADPFIPVGTGPTAWLPPLFPLMIAMCFKLFGVYTSLAAWSVLALDCLFSAATSPAVYEIGARCFNRRVAIWSGWIWALYPAAMQYAVKWVWETTLTTMLFAWVLVIALRVRGIGDASEENPQTIRRWALFGLLWGLIALSNPSLLLFLPVCGLWMLLGAKRASPALARAVFSGLIFLGCLAPWSWRNWAVFHALIPIRGNFGAESWYANGPDAQGFPYGVIVTAKPDLERLARVGELRYVRDLGEKANTYIKTHPGHFAALTVKRFYFYWVSIPHPLAKGPFLEYFREFHFCFLSITGLLGLVLAIKQRIPASGLFAAAFVLLPLTYYLVTVAARFRHPLEPLIAILTVYLFQSARKRKYA